MKSMVEPNLTRSALLLFNGFHAAPLFALAAVAVVAWVIVALNDAPSAPLILLITVLLSAFAIPGALVLSPGF
jgi:hypothetical protein